MNEYSIDGLAAQPPIARTIEAPGRAILDVNTHALPVCRNVCCVAPLEEVHALSRPRHANGGLSGTQNDNISSLLDQNIQCRPPHPHRGDRGLDLVGFLIRISGYNAKSTVCQSDGDITWLGVIKDRSIKLQSGV